MLFQIKNNIKTYAENTLSDDHFEVIQLNGNSKNIHWIDKNELIYKGELYDIIRTKTENNITNLYCLKDKAEEKLFADLQKELNKNSDNNLPQNNKSKNLVKLISDVFLIKKTQNIQSYNLRITTHYSYINTYSEINTETPSLPPEANS